ncbi:MAG: hypothetical protein ACFFAS_16040 [Promethearchaeota archaeon]
MTKIKKKIISLTVVFSMLIFSFAVPTTLAIGENVYDHSFDEEYWDVLYDYLGGYLEEDYNPGPYAGNSTQEDVIPDADAKFYQAYTNVMGVRSIYLAMQNFSWGLNAGFNASQYACAPFQVLVQHFNPAGDPSAHMFVINRFLGLMAYLDYDKDDYNPSIPSNNDNMYMGWAFYSGYHKTLINEFLSNNLSAPSWMLIDESVQTEATPIGMQKTTTASGDEYSFGMSYSNLFVVWQMLSATTGLDGNSTSAQLGYIVGASIIEELNFTYITTVENNNEVSTRVKYNIGNMTDLWIFSQYEYEIVQAIGGTVLNITDDFYIGYYNRTDGLQTRLEGYGSFPGFSLAIINTVNVISFSISTGVGTQLSFEDPLGTTLGASSIEIPSASCSTGGKTAYELNFEDTENYSLDGDPDHISTTFVLGTSLVATSINFGIILGFGIILPAFLANITQASEIIKGLILLQIAVQLSIVSFYYITCFPEWSGGTIRQDPTFTAYTGSIGGGPETSIPGYEIWLISLTGLAGISYVVLKLRKKRPQYFI